MADYVRSVKEALSGGAYKRALGYAVRKTKNFKKSPLAMDMNPDDITHEAVMKTLDGTRPWNQKKNSDLYVHLAGCIKSEISNIYDKYRKRNENSLLTPIYDISVNIDSPDKELESKEKEIILRNRINYILSYIASEREDLIKVAELMYQNNERKPQVIAEILGLSTREVGVKKVAIKRIFEKNKFIIEYVSNHQEGLVDTAIAIYREKITKAHEISKRCGVAVEEARSMREELSGLPEKVYRGEIY